MEFRPDYTTLGLNYVCSLLALALIAVRLICRRMRREKIWEYHDDMWMSFSIIPLIVRLATIHVVVVHGTNALPLSEDLSTKDIHRRELGSKVVLAGRISYAAYLWCMKGCILAFLSRLLSAYPNLRKIIKFIGWWFLASFVAVVNVTLLECRPFKLNYQVMPPPPRKCVRAFGQLITFGVINIIHDLTLIVLPIPRIYRSRLPLHQKLQVCLLFGVGFLDIAITVVRLPIIAESATIQNSRSFWASIEVLVACFIANAPILNNFVREYKRKRTRRGTGESYPSRQSMKRSDRAKSKTPIKDSIMSRLGRSEEDLNGKEMNEQENVGDRFVIEALTEVTQSVHRVPKETLKGHRTKGSKGGFLGTHVWTEQISPGSKSSAPSQRGYSHLNSQSVPSILIEDQHLPPGAIPTSSVPSPMNKLARQKLDQGGNRVQSQDRRGSMSATNIIGSDALPPLQFSLPMLPAPAVVARRAESEWDRENGNGKQTDGNGSRQGEKLEGESPLSTVPSTCSRCQQCEAQGVASDDEDGGVEGDQAPNGSTASLRREERGGANGDAVS